ncbi:MAG: HAMP domain-containing protein, partial [Clostridia bacterium]|nr:HAMP domain-containing protein [Clostridia bacterium]
MRVPRLRSIQSRMTLIVVLLVLLAMELVGAYLLHALQGYFGEEYRARLGATAEAVAVLAAGPLEQGDADRAAEVLLGFAESGVQILVTDATGVVVAASRDRSLLGRRLNSAEVVAALGGVPSDLVRSDPGAGGRKVYVGRPVTARGHVVGAVSASTALAPVDETLSRVRAILLTATALALLVSILLSLVLGRTITGPVQDLTARASELAQGRFDRRIDVPSDDELGTLAETFNDLSQRLAATLAEITAEKRKAEAILENMADGIVAVDRGGRILLVNPAAGAMFGLAPATLTDQPVSALPGHEALAEPLIRVLQQAPSEGSPDGDRDGKEEAGQALD